MPELRALIHDRDPYAGIAPANPLATEPEWGGHDPIFDELVAAVRPALIIEVGSWLGDSTRHMARALRGLGLTDSRVLAVDTWLGAAEFWTDRHSWGHYLGLRCEHGYPTVYRQFLANVVAEGLPDYIVPFPLASSSAAIVLAQWGRQAQLVYIDGAHEEHLVRRDIADYRPLVAAGGTLFGDDWFVPSVRAAVEAEFPLDRIEVVRDRFWVVTP